MTTKTVIVMNINQNVHVVLTPRGEEVLREAYAKRDEEFPQINLPLIDVQLSWKKEGEGYTFQMYDFMNIFGPYLPYIPTIEEKYALFVGNNVELRPSS